MTNIYSINTVEDRKKNFLKSSICVASAIGMYEAEPYMRRFLNKPFQKIYQKQFASIQGGGYLEYAQKALEQLNLKDMKLLNINESNIDQVRKEIGIPKKNTNAGTKIIRHVLRQHSNIERGLQSTAQGYNAFCMAQKNLIVCNFDKFGAPIFHEIAHKVNAESKNVLMQGLRYLKPTCSILGAPLILITALSTDAKKKGEKNKTVDDFIKANCGMLTFATLLPRTIEECIANIRGTKIAKNAGVNGEMMKKVIKAHWTSAFSYCTGAIITSLSVYLANKIHDKIVEKSSDMIDKKL